MQDIDLNILECNPAIDNAIDYISKLEENSGLTQKGDLIKWKSYQHQVVVESDSYFYKIYEEQTRVVGNFNSILRRELANVYNSRGIDWKIITVENNGQLLDFEQRQKLRVATSEDGPFENILISVADVLEEVEKNLEFDEILKQLRENTAFAEVSRLKLLRFCINKYEDYAIFNNQAILLDDADFYIAAVDGDGNVIDIDEKNETQVNTRYGDFLFTRRSDVSFETEEERRFAGVENGITKGWYLMPLPVDSGSDCLQVKNKDQSLTMEKDKQVMKNVETASAKTERLSFRQRAKKSNDEQIKIMSKKQLDDDDLLYCNNVGKKSFQWELWQCCNNLCKFCYLGMDNRHTDKERQLKSLHDLMSELETLDWSLYNNVSLIGGEFFQGQLADEEVREAFFKLIKKLCELYNDKKIGSIWITATLTIGDQADLYKMLDMFEEAGVLPLPEYGASGVWICTSWDAHGRFTTEQRKKNWEFHMKNMSAYYPWVKKNTTIILTQQLCEMYLEGEFEPKSFMDDFETFLFYKQPGMFALDSNGTGDMSELIDSAEHGNSDEVLMATKQAIEKALGFRFFPERKIFRKFLIKYAKNDTDTYERLFNIVFRADELSRNFNNRYEADAQDRDKNSNLESSSAVDSIINKDCPIEPFEKKHIINYATYIDSNDCMICDRNLIFESVQKGRM